MIITKCLKWLSSVTVKTVDYHLKLLPVYLAACLLVFYVFSSNSSTQNFNWGL